MVWGAAALAAGAYGSLTSYIANREAADAQKAAAMESLRREDLARADVLGQAKLAAGASGLETGGGSSMSLYLQSMATEFQRQHARAFDAAQEGAALSASANNMNLFSGLGSSLFRFAESNNWWQGAPKKG